MANESLSSAQIKLNFSATLQNIISGSASGNPASASIQADLINGNILSGLATGQADRLWFSEERALGSGGQETLNLYQMTGIDIGAGTGNDALGQACIFENIFCLIVKNEADSAGMLEVQPGTSNPLNAIAAQTVANGGAIEPGGLRVWYSPGVGIDLSSTKKNVKFDANGGALHYSVYVLGRHDDEESSSSSSTSSSSRSSSSSSSKSSSSTSSSSSGP